MNLMYMHIDFYRDTYFGYLKIWYLYYQTHVMYFHFWMTLLLFYLMENLVDLNTPLLQWISIVLLSSIKQ